MTVSTTLNKQVFPGNGATTVFNFSFAFPGGSPTQEAANIQVFFTDALGNVSLIAPTAYTLVLNPPTGTDPTPVGGSVTYSPVGGPIALGTFLTVFRNLTFDQATSLANQQTLYQQVIEAALDYQVMLSQQLDEVQNRALVVPVSDPVPNPLPAVAQRAGLILGFDSNGNPVAVNAAPAGVISAPMIPVVGASSLAQARTNMGLGTIATESIGLGLADNGSGAVQISPGLFKDSTNQSVALSFHTSLRQVQTPITYTLPLSSTLFRGFYFTIETRGFATTITPNAADGFDGLSTGASLTLPAGTFTTFVTDAAGTWYIAMGAGQGGNNSPINCLLVATVGAGAMTIALKDRNGFDPTPASPILYTIGTGGFITQRAITTPLSITIPSGATLGTANNFWSRVWVGIFDNAGTPVLGVYQSISGINSAASSIVCWQEWNFQNTNAISAGSNNAQNWYTTGALTSVGLKVVGYIDSAQPTAGSWTNAPGFIQLFGPGVKKPGDVVQIVKTTFASIGLAGMAAANMVEFLATALVTNNGTPANVIIAANTGNLLVFGFGAAAVASSGTVAFVGLHAANATFDTYTISVAANNTLNADSMTLKEIQA